MDNYIFINGSLIAERKCKIPVSDRGFLYGDGVFETLRSYKGNLFVVKMHISRLFKSLGFFSYKHDFNENYIIKSIKETLKANHLSNSDAYIKIIVTRGNFSGDLGFDSKFKPNLIIITKTLTSYPEKFYRSGAKAITSTIRRTSSFNPIYRHKSINYLESIYAKNEAKKKKALEALFLTEDNIVLECATSNIFMEKDNRIYTPSLELNILPGITRRIIIGLCRENNIDIVEEKIYYQNLLKADFLFLTNSIMEIMPVQSIDNSVFKEVSESAIFKELAMLYTRKTST
ncbi:MAG: aminotransferase class IV [Candidatus Humimicrobiaceae bacterium]